MSMDLKSHGLPAEFVLFGEDASRVLISCDQQKLAQSKRWQENTALRRKSLAKQSKKAWKLVSTARKWSEPHRCRG